MAESRSNAMRRLSSVSSWKDELNKQKIDRIKSKRNIREKYKSYSIVKDPQTGSWMTQKELWDLNKKRKETIQTQLEKEAREEAEREHERIAQGQEKKVPLYKKMEKDDEKPPKKINKMKRRQSYYEHTVKEVNHVDEYKKFYKAQQAEQEKKKEEIRRLNKSLNDSQRETQRLMAQIKEAQKSLQVEQDLLLHKFEASKKKELAAIRRSLIHGSPKVRKHSQPSSPSSVNNDQFSLTNATAQRLSSLDKQIKLQKYLAIKEKQKKIAAKSRKKLVVRSSKLPEVQKTKSRKVPDREAIKQKYAVYLLRSRQQRAKRRAKRAKAKKRRKRRKKVTEEPIVHEEHDEDDDLDELTVSDVLSELSEVEEEMMIPTSAKRQHCIKECLTTERDYVGHLNVLNEMYYKPISEQKMLPDDIISLIFDDLHVIRVVHEEFLQSIEEYFATNFVELTDDERAAHEAAGNDDLASLPKEMGYSIGEIFLQAAPTFKKYTSFVNDYERCVDIVTNQRSKYKKLYSFLDETSNQLIEDGKRITNLESYLILPIQRIPRYRMLLELMVKSTDPSHHDKESIERALELIKNLANYINDVKKHNMNQERMKELSKELKMKNLVIPGRSYINEGQLVSFKGKKRKEVSLYLFSDILMYKFRKRVRVIPLYEHPKGSTSVLTPGGSLVDRARKIFTVEAVATEADPFGFELTVITKGIKLKFICNSKYQLNKWMTIFEENYDHVLSENAGLMVTLTLPETFEPNVMTADESEMDTSTTGNDESSTPSTVVNEI